MEVDILFKTFPNHTKAFSDTNKNIIMGKVQEFYYIYFCAFDTGVT